MCLVQIHVRCADKFFEVLPEEVEIAEFAVEDLVSHILMDLSLSDEEVVVDNVTINFRPQLFTKQQFCAIHVQAHCPITLESLQSEELENLELILEERLCNALVEIFGTVDVEMIEIRPPLLAA